MSAVQETFDATVNRLKGYRSELTEADEQLAAARQARNASEVSRLTVHVQTLREFVTDEEALARVEAEQVNRADAERLMTELSDAYRANIALVDAAAEDARSIVKEAAQAISEVYRVYNQTQWVFRSLELLRLRFPDLGGATVAPPPAPPNVAVALFSTEGGAVENVPRPILDLTASMSREQRSRAGLVGLEEFLSDHARSLPASVQEFFERAGASPKV